MKKSKNPYPDYLMKHFWSLVKSLNRPDLEFTREQKVRVLENFGFSVNVFDALFIDEILGRASK